MSQFINNTETYSIVSQKELAVLLATFETPYIYSVIQNNLINKFDPYFFNSFKPNAVGSFEMNFKNLFNTYPMDHENIKYTRQQTYNEIINILANEYQFKISELGDDLQDNYPLAYYMYDLLVANFTSHIVNFFVDYILREKEAIYTACNLDAVKKNKDSSTLYGKKAYEDPKIAVINANLMSVLNDMAAFDIPFNVILNYAFLDKNVANLLATSLIPTVDFFKTYYCEAIKNPSLAPAFVTNVRLEIQARQGFNNNY